MDRIRKGKIQVGSFRNILSRAKALGQFCPKELYLFNIIADLHSLCALNNSYEVEIYLEQLMNTLINDNSSLCAYRPKRNDTLNIQGLPEVNFNTIGTIQETKVVSTDVFLSTTDNADLVFTTDDFVGTLVLNDNLNYGIKITSLPANGQLTLDGVAVILNNIISFSDINLNLFKFVPIDIDVNYVVNFSFQICII